MITSLKICAIGHFNLPIPIALCSSLNKAHLILYGYFFYLYLLAFYFRLNCLKENQDPLIGWRWGDSSVNPSMIELEFVLAFSQILSTLKLFRMVPNSKRCHFADQIDLCELLISVVCWPRCFFRCIPNNRWANYQSLREILYVYCC